MKGEILKKLRKEKGITQQQLSDGTGLGGSTIRMMETNQRKGSIEAITAIAKYFNVSIDYLEGRTEYKNSKDVADEIIAQLKNYSIIQNENDITEDILNIIAKHVAKEKH